VKPCIGQNKLCQENCLYLPIDNSTKKYESGRGQREYIPLDRTIHFENDNALELRNSKYSL